MRGGGGIVHSERREEFSAVETAQTTMKDRLNELQQAVWERPGSSDTSSDTSSTKWYDQPAEKMLIKTDEKPLLSKTKEISAIYLKFKVSKKSVEDVKVTKFLANLYAKVESIKSDVSQIKSNTKDITALHTHALMVPSVTPHEKAKMEELDKITRLVSSRVVALLKDLQQIDVPNTAATKRIHSVQLSQAHKSFVDAAEKYEVELGRYARGLRQQVAKQLAIANGGRCDSDVVDACIEGGKLQMFVDNYLTTEHEVRKRLGDVQDRHKELLEIESTLLEVRDLFANISLLVIKQGDMIDNIEAHVEAANTGVSTGRKTLSSAKKKQRSARKKKVLLATAGTAVATGLIVTLALL